MSRRRLSRSLLGAAVLAAPLALWGQTESTTGAAATADPMQVLGQGARPLAMGSAFTAVKGDLMAALFNPAGQAYLRGAQASAHHNAWLGGINQDSLAAVLAGRALSVGIYGDLVNYGAIDATDDNGNPTGSFTPMDFTLGLALAREFSNGLALGGTVRGTQQSLQDSGQLITSGDLGLMWAGTEQPITLGLAYSNLGPAVNGKPPTSALRLGLSYDLPLTARSSVLFAGGGSGMNNGASLIQLGVEGRLGGVFFLRGGYQFSFLDSQTGGLTGLSSGLGAKVGALVLDYAYLPYGRVGSNHRLSVSFQFDDGSNNAPKVQVPADGDAAGRKTGRGAKAGSAHSEASPQPSAPSPQHSAAVDMVFEIPANSLDSLQAAVQQHPQDAEAWKALGRYYYGQKDKTRMLEAFDRALALDPGDQDLKDWVAKVRR